MELRCEICNKAEQFWLFGSVFWHFHILTSINDTDIAVWRPTSLVLLIRERSFLLYGLGCLCCSNLLKCAMKINPLTSQRGSDMIWCQILPHIMENAAHGEFRACKHCTESISRTVLRLCGEHTCSHAAFTDSIAPAPVRTQSNYITSWMMAAEMLSSELLV